MPKPRTTRYCDACDDVHANVDECPFRVLDVDVVVDRNITEAWLDVVPVDRYGDPGRQFPICDEPSPTGRMLCILPRTDLYHHHGQHLGLDRHGNFRGWTDRRTPT